MANSNPQNCGDQIRDLILEILKAMNKKGYDYQGDTTEPNKYWVDQKTGKGHAKNMAQGLISFLIPALTIPELKDSIKDILSEDLFQDTVVALAHTADYSPDVKVGNIKITQIDTTIEDLG